MRSDGRSGGRAVMVALSNMVPLGVHRKQRNRYTCIGVREAWQVEIDVGSMIKKSLGGDNLKFFFHSGPWQALQEGGGWLSENLISMRTFSMWPVTFCVKAATAKEEVILEGC